MAKKILYIANARIPTEKAHGLQIIRMCEAFVKKGAEVTLLVPKRKNFIQENAFNYYGVNPKSKFNVVKLPILDTIKFGKLGFLFITLQFAFLSKIYSLFRKYDLVFTRDEFIASSQILIGKKVFWESHTGSYNIWAKLSLRFSKKIIVISNGLKRFYIDKKIKENKIVVLHDGIRLEDFNIEDDKEDIRKRLYLPKPEEKIIMYTGHLYDWKGVHVLAEAATKLSNFNFVFIGGTEKDVKSFKSKYKNYKNIQVLGHKKNDLIPYYLKAADLLIIPNSKKSIVSRSFTSPMKMFEYMASEVPIIYSDLPSMKEVLNDSNAIFFESDNSDSLVSRIKEVFSGDFEEEVGQLAKKAKKDVEKYTWNNRADIILNNIK